MSKEAKVDFSTVLKTLDGEDMKERSGIKDVASSLVHAGMSPMLVERAIGLLKPLWGTGGEPKEVILTAARACANALQAPGLAKSGAEIVDRIRLAIKIMDPKQPVELTEVEEKMILDALEYLSAPERGDQGWSPIITYRIKELLSPTSSAGQAVH